MNNHDPLCRGVYQRYTDPMLCASCDLIAAVREDDRNRYDINIGKLEAAYLQGYSQGLDTAALTVEEYFNGIPSLSKIHVNTVITYILNNNKERNNAGNL